MNRIKKIDARKLKEAADNKDIKKIEELIENFFDQKPKKADLGEEYFDQIMTYIKASNDMDRDYVRYLKDALESLKQLKELERKNEEELKVLSIKKKLVSRIEKDEDLD